MNDTDYPEQHLTPQNKKADHYELFRLALETMRYEGALLWQIFAAFLLIHTVIAGLLMEPLREKVAAGFYPGPFFTACAALMLCIPWYASYSRNAAHYRYHLARVRNLEPAHWHIYGGEGRKFSSGHSVSIGDQTHHLGWMARTVKSGRMIPPVIAIFVLSYTGVGVFSGPWWKSLPEKKPANQITTVKKDQ